MKYRDVHQSSENILYAFTDIHGDFKVLVELLTSVLKVATVKEGVWEWIAENTTVVCLGDFVDRYRVSHDIKISTQDAIQDEIKIINCFISLQKQAKLDINNSSLIVLMGNHELGNLLNFENYYRYQIMKPNNLYERHLRKKFVEQHLKPFASNNGVIIGWANYFFCHGGLELEWLNKHQFQSIEDINKRWMKYVRENVKWRLKMFAEDDSILMSRKMALHPDIWRETDKFGVTFLLSYKLNPKFVIGHTTVYHIEIESFNYNIPRCIDAKKSSILSSRDYTGLDDIYYIDVELSDGFIGKQMEENDRYNRRPQALKLVVHTDSKNNMLFEECETVVMHESEFKVFDKTRYPEQKNIK
jgi:hypothetical protein